MTGFGQTTLSGMVMKTTESAVLFMPDGGDEVWIPRRCCLDGASLEDGDTDIAVADWWLRREGLL